MNVTYTPALSEQIKGRHKVDLELGEKPVSLKIKGRFLERINPQTRQSTGEAQQFTLHDSKLVPLARASWTSHPTVIELDWMSFS